MEETTQPFPPTQPQPPLHVAVPANLIEASVDADAFTADIQELYDAISGQIRSIVGGAKFDIKQVGMLAYVITKNVQKYAKEENRDIPGAAKQQIALRVVKHVLTDFKKTGQLDDQLYSDLLLAVELVGPTIIDLSVAAWKKTVDTVNDISEHGCSGCTKRNCCVQ